jgi:hypothetical protein
MWTHRAETGTRRPEWIRLGALLFALASACGGSPEPAPRTPAESTPSTPGPASAKSAAVAVDEAPSEITLLSPGDEPRRALRYVFHVGTNESMRMELHMAIGMSISARATPTVTAPAMRLTLEVEPREILPGGDLRFGFKLLGSEVEPDPETKAGLLDVTRREMQKLNGLAGEAVVTARGVTKRVAMSLPPDTNDQVAELLDSVREAIKDMSSPFPEQAVGRGARWTAVQPIRVRTLRVTRSVTYTLGELSGDTGALADVVELTAPPQPIEDKRLPPSSTMKLDALTATGEGTVRFDLQSLVPKADFKVDSLASTTITSPERSTPVSISTKIAVSIDRARP